MNKAVLVLVRHGQSEYNLQNRFTGWVDVELTDKGREEARAAGKEIKDEKFDVIYTSALKRAQHTMEIIQKENGWENLPVIKNQALNERHYGDLQGLNKAETAVKFGEEQVHQWRRSYDIQPPHGESLKDTCDRVMPYFDAEILPRLEKGENVLVVAHGNSLRALVMTLEHLSPEQIVKREIGTGEPIRYEMTTGEWASFSK